MYIFCARPFEEEEEEEEEDGEIGVLGNFTYTIVAVYFTTFESLIVYRNTRSPCYVSKRAHSCCVRQSEPLLLLRLNGRVGAIPTYRVYRLYDIAIFMQSLYYTSNFLNFLFICLLSFFYYCKQ